MSLESIPEILVSTEPSQVLSECKKVRGLQMLCEQDITYSNHITWTDVSVESKVSL